VSDSRFALSFGSAADAYERGRPEWPRELLDRLPVPPEAEVLDLAAGTGKLTRLLVDRYRRVTAVEPDPDMRRLLGLVTDCYLEGTAEAIPLADASVDAVFVGEAFHWFDAPRAVAEIARVLRPRGVLALLWHRYPPSADVLPEGVLPRARTAKHRLLLSGDWRVAFDGAPFEPLREETLARDEEMPREQLVDYFASISPVATLPPGERERTLAAIAAALERPTYRRRWTTHLYWTRRAA